MKLSSYRYACITIHNNIHIIFRCKWYSPLPDHHHPNHPHHPHHFIPDELKFQKHKFDGSDLLLFLFSLPKCRDKHMHTNCFCGLHWEMNISLKIKVTDDCYKDMCLHVQSVLILPVHMWNSDLVYRIIYLHYKTTHINSTANYFCKWKWLGHKKHKHASYFKQSSLKETLFT